MKIHIPAKLGFLYKPSRYKIAYGGRGSGKSWGFAQALLIKGLQNPLRILCAREFQVSLSDSVHALLCNQIEVLGLQSFYEIQKSRIIGANGTEITYAGLRHNISTIRSKEGIDICWVEEADTTSNASLDVLIPTLRKDGSEIWFTFNPVFDSDPVYKRFVLDQHPDAVVVKMNWSDNTWFPAVLEKEKEILKQNDHDAYLHVWEGFCRQTLEGAIYAREIRMATKEGRIRHVPVNTAKPVETFWDLGKRDHTSIWFAQFFNGEYRIIDFYQNFGENIQHYLQVVQNRGYFYAQHWLPHDAKQDRMNGPTIERIVRDAYPNMVRILPSVSVVQGINAGRTIFPNCYFDEKKCADGLNALRRYRYAVDDATGQRGKVPLHDEYSDAADAFRYLALSLTERKEQEENRKLYEPTPFMGGAHNNTNWQGL
jgi:phage terminase large subunit